MKGANVEERLKSLMQDLGNAINESLSDSERIAEAIGEIKRAGYDVFLVLEATIGFNKRDDSEESGSEEMSEEPTEDRDYREGPLHHAGSAISQGLAHHRGRRGLAGT